jgi:hypothetical protein
MEKVTLVAVLSAVALTVTGCEVFGAELINAPF